MIKRLKHTPVGVILAILIMLPWSVHSELATDRANAIIAKVLNAYGGSQLTQAQSITLIDYNKGPWPGESEHPGVPEIWRINEELTIDFVKQRKSLLSYRVPRTDLDLEKWIFDGEKTIKYDIYAKKYSYENWVTYDGLGGGIVRTSDTMLARQLNSSLKSAVFEGTQFYRGLEHEKLRVTLHNGSDMLYFVNTASGLITKMLRDHPRAGMLTYVFSNHQQRDGVTYSGDLNFFVDGTLRLTSVVRDIRINPPLEAAFAHLQGFSHWGETIDSAKMRVEEITRDVWQAGEGRALSVFVEHPDYFIAFGSANALEKNFAALKALKHVDKPVKYLLVTHHHAPYVEGLEKAMKLGAKLIVSQAHLNTIMAALPKGSNPQNLLIIPDRKVFSLGRVKFFDIATAHSQHYLLAYLPDSKIVYDEAHYESDLKTAAPRFFPDTLIFRKAVERLNLDVDSFIHGHSWRQFSGDEFRMFTDNLPDKTCPEGYSICAKG